MNTSEKVASGAVAIELNIGGTREQHHLYFDMGYLASMQLECGGKSTDEVLQVINKGFDAPVFTAALWAGLLHEDPERPVKSLERLRVGPDELPHVQARLIAAIQMAEIDEDELVSMGNNLALMDKHPRPFELARAMQIVMNAERLRKFGDASVNLDEMLLSLLASQEKRSGGSRPESASGSSGAKRKKGSSKR